MTSQPQPESTAFEPNGHQDALDEHRARVQRRAAGREHAPRRGTRTAAGVASGAYRAEGRVQCAEQMDIWQCIAATEDGATEGAPDEQQ